FHAIAVKRGRHWEADKETRDNLCVALRGMMIDYLPLDLTKHLHLIMFGTVLTAAVSARIVEDARLQEERRKAVKARQDGGHKGAASESAIGLADNVPRE
ncbi:unnamed protein product, partial [marine sediment metagenome]